MTTATKVLILNASQQASTLKVLAEAKALCLKEIYVFFGGTDGDGHIQEVQFFEDSKRLASRLRCRAIENSIKKLARELLYTNYGCWQDAEGATGRVIFDAELDAIYVELGWYYCAIEADNREFELSALAK